MGKGLLLDDGRNSYELPASRQGGRITNYELRITKYKLQITNYKLQITNYELQILNTKSHSHHSIISSFHQI